MYCASPEKLYAVCSIKRQSSLLPGFEKGIWGAECRGSRVKIRRGQSQMEALSRSSGSVGTELYACPAAV